LRSEGSSLKSTTLTHTGLKQKQILKFHRFENVNKTLKRLEALT